MANWGSGPATPGAPSRFALSGRTSHRGCREVSGDWRTWVLWFNVPAQSRRVAVAMPVPLGCRLRHRGAIRECLVARGHRTGQVCAGAGGAGGRFTWRATDPDDSRLLERGRERGNRRKGSAPRHRSLLSSLNSIEPGSLPSEPCDPDVQNARRPGICLTCNPARVLDDVGQGAWHCTARLVYGVLHGFILPVWRGMGSRPRRAHSRLGGAAVVTGSGEVAPKLHGLSGPRRIAPLSTDKRCPVRHGRQRPGVRDGFRGDVALGQHRIVLQPAGPVGVQNWSPVLTWDFYAARSYSLMRPPSTGLRLIRFQERSVAG